MSTVAFIGVGVMGLPMATNLVRAGHDVTAFDTDPRAVDRIEQRGATAGSSAADAARGYPLMARVPMLRK